jgi:1-aminocyclopropane-1-carboxylate deaminase/D-cysteine desulfhydrase-like pyridoxal-dependent ACC family enzyme
MFPTPIHRWRLPGIPQDVEVYIKRDDMTGMTMSGG